MPERASAPRILTGAFFGRGWLSPPPPWGYLMTSTAARLAYFTPDHVAPDAILMMLLDTAQQACSPVLYAEIARRLAACGCPRDVTLLWTWCAAADGDLLSQRRIARELNAEAASPDPRIRPDAATSLAAEWKALAGSRSWLEMSSPVFDEEPFPEPHFELASVPMSLPHLI